MRRLKTWKKNKSSCKTTKLEQNSSRYKLENVKEMSPVNFGVKIRSLKFWSFLTSDGQCDHFDDDEADDQFCQNEAHSSNDVAAVCRLIETMKF